MSGFAVMVAVVSGWAVLVIGLVGLLGLSVVVGLSIGSMLGQISREISSLLDADPIGGLTPRSASSASPHAGHANRA